MTKSVHTDSIRVLIFSRFIFESNGAISLMIDDVLVDNKMYCM
jgi:hypothetical protein